MRQHTRVKIHPSSVVFALALMLLEGSAICLIPFAAALCHELGHIAAMLIFGIHANRFELTLFGAQIDTLPLGTDIFKAVTIYAAGPTANIICATVTAMLWQSPGSTLFCACSISLAVINLLPIRSLDGGGIAEAILSEITPLHAHVILNALSAATLFLLWLLAVYLLLLFDGNISLLLFCEYLFVTLFFQR